MAMTSSDLLEALRQDVPECQLLVAEHLSDNDRLLLHLLTGDLLRFAFESFRAGQSDVLNRLLVLVDVALREGTDDVQNAMAVSFVEDAGWWDPSSQAFIESWPAGLRAEVDRQRSYHQ